MSKMFDVHELKNFQKNSKGFLGFPKYVVFLNETVYETNNFIEYVSWYPKKSSDEYYLTSYDKIAEFNVNFDELFENFENLIKSIEDKSPEILL